jgi:phosphoribosylanthranilate isomerase
MSDVRVKICGITSLEDAERATGLGAWAVGLIFHRPSPRSCAVGEAAAIAAALRRRVEVAGVFVNRPLDEVVGRAEEVGLSIVQLHGDEGPAYCGEVARRTGCRVMKARQVRSGADLLALAAFHVDLHLLDAHAPGLRGGTGETFDWRLASRRHSAVPMLLSGGLTPDNVGEAIAQTSPWGVDVASGVEARPGRKDPARLEAFFGAVRGAPAPEAVR